MIVGTVHQEVGYSWQDACDAWAAQNEGTEAGVHQVEVSRMEAGQEKKDQCKEVNEADQGGEQPEAGGLLVEGEEREYILELLMREAPPSQPADIPSPRVGVNTLKGKKKRNLGKKLHKKLKLAKGAAAKEPRKEGGVNLAGGREKQVASNLPHNPEVKGRGLAGGGQDRGGQTAASPSTSGGECSG
jgi:hypothetical protein